MNKPVAYFLKYKDETYIECPSSVVGAIPLYTHPVKELTDDEIEEVINRTYWVGTEDEIRMKIAKAILRKAQEQ